MPAARILILSVAVGEFRDSMPHMLLLIPERMDVIPDCDVMNDIKYTVLSQRTELSTKVWKMSPQLTETKFIKEYDTLWKVISGSVGIYVLNQVWKEDRLGSAGSSQELLQLVNLRFCLHYLSITSKCTMILMYLQ